MPFHQASIRQRNSVFLHEPESSLGVNDFAVVLRRSILIGAAGLVKERFRKPVVRLMKHCGQQNSCRSLVRRHIRIKLIIITKYRAVDL